MVWAGFLVAWFMFVVGTIDNVVKSLVIGRNSPLPLSLILFGVIGGAIAFGMLGVFLGPTLLSLFYTLLRNWVNKPEVLSGADAEAKSVSIEGPSC